MKPGDRARVSVSVDVPPHVAFDVFTTEIDRWWRRGAKFRHAGARGGFVHIEPHVDGRVFESIDGAAGPHVFEIGRVHVWEPPARLAFSWRNANFAPHEITEVEVAFTAQGEGTLVTVTHTGWAAPPDDHPARHGLQGAEFVRMIALWWGDLLTSLRMNARR